MIILSNLSSSLPSRPYWVPCSKWHSQKWLFLNFLCYIKIIIRISAILCTKVKCFFSSIKNLTFLEYFNFSQEFPNGFFACLFWRNLVVSVCVSVFCLHMCIHTTCAWYLWSSEEGIRSLELEVWMVMNDMGAGNWIRVLCKSSQCS